MDAYLNSALEKSGGEEKDKNTCALARLASLGEPRRGMAMGTGARRAPEWSVEIRSKASQVHDFLLLFFCYKSVSDTF
jgi:hypothetical protein